MSKDLTRDQTYANRPDITTPWGKMSWSPEEYTDPATGELTTKWSANLSLSPDQQAALDDQMKIQAGRSDAALGMLDDATTALNRSYVPQSAKEMFDQAFRKYDAQGEYQNSDDWKNSQADTMAWWDNYFAQDPDEARRHFEAMIRQTGPNRQDFRLGSDTIDWSSVNDGGQQIDPVELKKQDFSAEARLPVDRLSTVDPVQLNVKQGNIHRVGEIGDTQRSVNYDVGGTRNNFVTGEDLSFNIPGGEGGFSNAGGIDLNESFDPGRAVQFDLGNQQFGLQGGLQGQTMVDRLDYTPDEWRRQAQDAVLKFMDPVHRREQAQLETQLANMGLTRGTDAWDAELQRLQDQHSRNRLTAFSEGRAEAAQLFDQAVRSGEFTNTARRQQFDIDKDRLSWLNDLSDQELEQLLTRGEFYNDAQKQQFGQNKDLAQFGNDARIAEGEASRDAARVNNDAAYKQGSLGIDAGYKSGLLNLDARRLTNEAINSTWDRDLDSAKFERDSQAQDFGQQKDRATFTNDAADAEFNQNLKEGVFYNQAQGQASDQAYRSDVFQNTVAQQEFDNLIKNAQFGDQQALAELKANMEVGKYNEVLRDNDIARQQLERIMPLNELNALLTGQQVSMPTMPTFSQATKAETPNMLGAANLGYNADLNAWQADQNSSTSLMNGLFSLGGAAIGGGGWGNLFKFS